MLFCGGLRSDMQGTKALALEAWCQQQGIAYCRFDYRGHGESDGLFTDGTISSWLADASAIVEKLNQPTVVVGSSLGGWLALMLARAYPQLVCGMVGLAAAPDFTEDLMWQAFSPQQQADLHKNGMITLPSPYGEPLPVTRALIDDGRKHLLLRAPLHLSQPVWLLHGAVDTEVPLAVAQQLVTRLPAGARLTIIPDGDHRLSRPQDLALAQQAIRWVRGR